MKSEKKYVSLLSEKCSEKFWLPVFFEKCKVNRFCFHSMEMEMTKDQDQENFCRKNVCIITDIIRKMFAFAILLGRIIQKLYLFPFHSALVFVGPVSNNCCQFS